jgi:hypothetical protein
VNAASSSSSAVNQPWTVQLFKRAEAGVTNLSTAFAGNPQLPVISYSKTGSQDIYVAYPATAAVPGNCGPSTRWHCRQLTFTGLIPSTLSQMVVTKKTNTFQLQWAYATGTMIQGATLEMNNDFSDHAQSHEDLIKIGKFGANVIGAPSLANWNGYYEMAVTIEDSSDFYGHTLVFMHHVGSPFPPCLDGTTSYECYPIDQTTGFNSMGPASFYLAPDGNFGISYFKAGASNGLMLAYPHSNSPQVPSNCGPGLNSWRCISIFPNNNILAPVGQIVKVAVGKNAAEEGIAFTIGTSVDGWSLMSATFVGSAGNCGDDRNSFDNTQVWRCSLLWVLGKMTSSFSIAIDPQGYPVIAYDRATEDLAPVDLYLTYPNARVGIGTPGWVEQTIDDSPTTMVTTGGQAALALSSSGLGFIGYLQEEAYATPDLKIAWQNYRISLPLVIH